MGIYLNPGNELFAQISKNKIYVDKSGMIPALIEVFERWNQYVCVSRPRRFGKTVIGNMLCAYFSKGCNSKELFKNSIGSKDPIFEKYLNKVNVIKIDLNSEYQNIEDKALTTLAFVIGLALIDNLSSTEQNAVGNWIMKILLVLFVNELIKN